MTGFVILIALFIVGAVLIAHIRISLMDDGARMLREWVSTEAKWSIKYNERNEASFARLERRLSELELNQERPANKGAMAKKRTVKAAK